MKRLFVVFACLVCASVIKGQDIITFADGTEVQAKVIEVGISEITYKLYEYPDGPSYIRNRNEIQKITYENGQRQLFGSAIQNYLKSGAPGIIAYNPKTAKATIDGADVADERLQQYFSADDYKLFNTVDNANSRSFLESQDVDAATIDKICEAINSVSFSKNGMNKPATIEGMIVQDADRLDALGAIGIARTFAFGGEHGRSIDSTIEHFHNKLLLLKDGMNTGSARKMAESRHAFMEEFLARYENENKDLL